MSFSLEPFAVEVVHRRPMRYVGHVEVALSVNVWPLHYRVADARPGGVVESVLAARVV